jgi:hypothetical protein
MARHPEWFERLDSILDEVRESPLEYFSKPEITALFGFRNDRDGFRLLRKFGADMVDDRLSLARSTLLAQIEAVRSGAAYAAFLNTRAEVARQLRASGLERAKRQFRVPASAPPRPQLKDLPTTIRWRRADPALPGRFEVVYDDGADLLWQIAQFLHVVGLNRAEYTEATEPAPE